ncbi:Common central domain of tyrosinase, partial [Rhizoctonia solani]
MKPSAVGDETLGQVSPDGLSAAGAMTLKPHGLMDPGQISLDRPKRIWCICKAIELDMAYINLNMFLATRHNLLLWTGLFIALPGVLLAPTKGPKCTKPAIRREWRTLSPSQQDAFHKAVKCLQTKPSRIQSGGVSKTLYDDYTYIHLQLEPLIHQVAALYPWHRYFNSLREKDMQACGYTQPHPYWDWTRDAASASAFRNASIFDPIHGFGSPSAPEGNTTVVCVDNGPYAGFQFFLHHAQFDRLWTLWQGRNATRLSDYQGNTIQNTTVFNATLQDTLDFMGLGDNRSVESVMDTLSNGLCYKYDDDE